MALTSGVKAAAGSKVTGTPDVAISKTTSGSKDDGPDIYSGDAAFNSIASWTESSSSELGAHKTHEIFETFKRVVIFTSKLMHS